MSTRAELFGGVVHAWGRILSGHRPNLSIEITREGPLRCPGCYAFGDAHLGGDVTLRGLSDYKGNELVEQFLALVDEMRPRRAAQPGSLRVGDTVAHLRRPRARPRAAASAVNA
jgi:hypothetical protein